MAITRDFLRSVTLGAPKRAFRSQLVVLRNAAAPKVLEAELDSNGVPRRLLGDDGVERNVEVLRHPPVLDEAGQSVKVELREPNLRERGAIERAVKVDRSGELASVDMVMLKVELVTRMTYVPGTNQKVFDEKDRDGLLAQPAGGFVDDLFEVAVGLFNAEPAEEAGKNSNGTA